MGYALTLRYPQTLLLLLRLFNKTKQHREVDDQLVLHVQVDAVGQLVLSCACVRVCVCVCVCVCVYVCRQPAGPPRTGGCSGTAGPVVCVCVCMCAGNLLVLHVQVDAVGQLVLFVCACVFYN